jgi:hypothetical protein
MAGKKFVNLHESYMRRYERGGFLVGDVFKFNDDYQSTDCYKALPKVLKDLLPKMNDSGLHIRVVGIKIQLQRATLLVQISLLLM